MADTESDVEAEQHDMNAPFNSPAAKAARIFHAAKMPNPTPYRGLIHVKTKTGKGRVKAQHTYTDSKGKRHLIVGPTRAWGMSTFFEGKHVIKTKEMAQAEAAHDHDDLKNAHEGYGLGEITTGRKAKFYGEFNFPDDINKSRAPHAQRAIDYVVNYVAHGQGKMFSIPWPYYVPT
jgi:hypothetical protein